jgi:hypothetical protein
MVCVFVLSLSVFGQDPRSDSTALSQLGSGVSAATSLTAMRDSAVMLLSKRVESVEWEDTPFEEVITWLKAEGGEAVNIVPRWVPLGVESIDRDTLVTLQLNNTTVGRVLSELLETLSEDGELRFRAWGNTLRISTRADFERKRLIRVYDATDIMLRIPDFGRGAPVIDLQNAGGQGGGGSGQSVFSGSSGGQEEQTGGEQAEQELKERLEELATMIRDVIAPGTWSQAGSTGGQGGGQNVIRVFNRSLIVNAPIEVHEKIGGPFAYDR